MHRLFPIALLVLLPLTACQRAPLLNYPEGYREFAYVANRGGNSVTALDLVYLRVDRTLAVGPAPVAVVANPLHDEVYAVSQGAPGAAGSVAIIDTRDNHIRTTIAVEREPVAIAVDPSGRRAYVVNRGSNSVSVLDLQAARVLKTLPSGGQAPDGVAVSPDGRSVVVTNGGSGSMATFTAAILPLRLELPAPAGVPVLAARSVFAGCAGASSPVIPRDSAKAFIACTNSDQVLALALAAAPDSEAVRQNQAAAADHLLALLDVGHKPTHLTAKPDGGEIFVSNSASDSISEISAQTNEVESTSQIGSHPAHSVVAADSSIIWVANTGADTLSPYSIDDGSRLPFVRTGVQPDALAFSADEKLLLAADLGSGDIAVIRTQDHPGLLTILPAGHDPVAIAIKAMPLKP